MHRPASIGVTRKNLQNTGEGGGLNAATCLIRRGAASHWREFFRGPLPPASPAPLQPHQFRLHHIMSLLSSLAHSSFFLSCYGFIRLCFWSDTALHPADPSTWSLGVDRPYPSPFRSHLDERTQRKQTSPRPQASCHPNLFYVFTPCQR